MSDVTLADIASLAKRRGFIYQGSEIYGGLAGTWDYGPLGVALKRNIINAWWKFFVDSRDDMYGLDTAILMNKRVWEVSGHATGFNDPLVECSNCKSRFRADQLEDDKCPTCGQTGKFGEAREFNMMFKTKIGPTSDEIALRGPLSIPEGKRVTFREILGAMEDDGDPFRVYLRPETAQGMFTNFKNVVDTFSPDLPFGIAQVGKAFRNEISPRDFIFRVREFEIAELEYFIHPSQWEEKFEMWRQAMHEWCKLLGLPADKIHELEVPENDRAHYSKRTVDLEFDFPFGKKELYGLAYRTDFDLASHQKASGKNLEYRPKDGGEPFLPHVIEPTFGIERTIVAVLCSAYTADELNGEQRVYLKLPKDLAPVKAAVSPLLKNKPELVSKAREVYDMLKKELGAVMWDDNGNIGKRYRRQDEIGTPHCITIDFQTLDDNTVTVRDRDTAEQKRVSIEKLTDSL